MADWLSSFAPLAPYFPNIDTLRGCRGTVSYIAASTRNRPWDRGGKQRAATPAWIIRPSKLLRRTKQCFRWDRPSPFVVCHPSPKGGWLTDDKKRSSVP